MIFGFLNKPHKILLSRWRNSCQKRDLNTGCSFYACILLTIKTENLGRCKKQYYPCRCVAYLKHIRLEQIRWTLNIYTLCHYNSGQTSGGDRTLWSKSSPNTLSFRDIGCKILLKISCFSDVLETIRAVRLTFFKWFCYC